MNGTVFPLCGSVGSRTTPHEDNSPPDNNKAQPMPTRTTIRRTIPHQDNSPLGPLPQNKTTHQDQNMYKWGIVLLGSCLDTGSVMHPWKLGDKSWLSPAWLVAYAHLLACGWMNWIANPCRCLLRSPSILLKCPFWFGNILLTEGKWIRIAWTWSLMIYFYLHTIYVHSIVNFVTWSHCRTSRNFLEIQRAYTRAKIRNLNDDSSEK